MVTDLTIAKCHVCGNEIVATIDDELPICNRIDCFREMFPDDFKEIIGG